VTNPLSSTAPKCMHYVPQWPHNFLRNQNGKQKTVKEKVIFMIHFYLLF